MLVSNIWLSLSVTRQQTSEDPWERTVGVAYYWCFYLNLLYILNHIKCVTHRLRYFEMFIRNWSQMDSNYVVKQLDDIYRKIWDASSLCNVTIYNLLFNFRIKWTDVSRWICRLIFQVARKLDRYLLTNLPFWLVRDKFLTSVWNVTIPTTNNFG